MTLVSNISFGTLTRTLNSAGKRRRRVLVATGVNTSAPPVARRRDKPRRILTPKQAALLMERLRVEDEREMLLAHKRFAVRMLSSICFGMTVMVALFGKTPQERMLSAIGSLVLGATKSTIIKDYVVEPQLEPRKRRRRAK